MRNISVFVAVAMAVLLAASCGERKVPTDIITHKEAGKVSVSPMRMQNYDHSETVEWFGRQYTVSVSRRAESDSSLVQDDSGNKYHNNQINVRITRPDGSDFFDKTFTKADFASVVSSSYRQKSTLLGIVVDHAEGSSLYLAASVGSPDALSDEYLPLIITISRTGGISVAKDNRFDAGSVQAGEDN